MDLVGVWPHYKLSCFSILLMAIVHLSSPPRPPWWIKSCSSWPYNKKSKVTTGDSYHVYELSLIWGSYFPPPPGGVFGHSCKLRHLKPGTNTCKVPIKSHKKHLCWKGEVGGMPLWRSFEISWATTIHKKVDHIHNCTFWELQRP